MYFWEPPPLALWLREEISNNFSHVGGKVILLIDFTVVRSWFEGRHRFWLLHTSCCTLVRINPLWKLVTFQVLMVSPWRNRKTGLRKPEKVSADALNRGALSMEVNRGNYRYNDYVNFFLVSKERCSLHQRSCITIQVAFFYSLAFWWGSIPKYN